MFISVSPFYPNIAMQAKLGESWVGPTWVGPSFACSDNTRVEVTDSDKHSSLLRYGINYVCKRLHMSMLKHLLLRL